MTRLPEKNILRDMHNIYLHVLDTDYSDVILQQTDYYNDISDIPKK